jgi:hypothetical protein
MTTHTSVALGAAAVATVIDSSKPVEILVGLAATTAAGRELGRAAGGALDMRRKPRSDGRTRMELGELYGAFGGAGLYCAVAVILAAAGVL